MVKARQFRKRRRRTALTRPEPAELNDRMAAQDRWLLTGVRVCLLPLVVSYTTVYPFVVGKALWARSLVEVAFAGWLLLAWRVPEYRPRPSVVLLAVLAWLVVSFLAALLGVNPTRSLWSGYGRMHGVVELAHWCGFILVAASVFRTFAAWRVVLAVNLAVGATVSALGLAGYFGVVGWVWLFSEAARAGSTLGAGLFMGAYTAMCAGLGAALLFQPWGGGRYWRAGWTRWLVASAVGLNLAGLWFSATRSGLLGTLVMLVVFAGGAMLLERRRAVARAALGLLAAAVLVVSVGLVSGLAGINADYDVMFRRLSSAGSGEDQSIRKRLGTLRLGLEAYRERPLLGWGPENYRAAWGRHVTAGEYSGRTVDQAHNKALDTLVTTGTVGFFFYSLLWLALALTAVRLALERQGGERRFALALAAALAGYLTISLFLFDTQSFILQFALLAAFFASQEHGGAALLRSWPGWCRRAIDGLQGPARRRYAVPAASLLLVAALAFSLFHWQAKPFMGAQNIRVRENWPQTLEEARGIYEHFPPLAAHWRTAMVTNTVSVMRSLPPHELEFSVDYVAEEIEMALAEEPESWHTHYLAARFYEAAAQQDDRYRELAQHHAGELRRVAPHSPYLEYLDHPRAGTASTTGVDSDWKGR